MPTSPNPPLTPLNDLDAQLASTGFALLDAATLARLADTSVAALRQLAPAWDTLPPDRHLRDGGGYRRRRHGCYIDDGGVLQPVPPRPHWQPLEYNALHGGIERWFDPLLPALADAAAFGQLLTGLARTADALRGPRRWFIEAHPFRIDTGGAGGIGRPTPEGAHRDGVDLVAVVLVARHNVKGGETRVFDAGGPQGTRFTLAEPWSVLLLDDARVVHETTPIQPLEPGAAGWRDTLVLTWRAGGFQGPAGKAHDNRRDPGSNRPQA